MDASALFQIDPGTGIYGASGIAQNAAGGVVVNCRLASTVGVNNATWRIFGTSGTATPAITLSGSPTGQIASFTLPSGVGQAYGVECKVNGGKGADFGDTKTGAVYVLDAADRRPFFIGETFEADAVFGVVPRLNSAIASGPAWAQYTVTYAQLAAASATNNIELFALPIKGVVHAVAIKHSTAFTGGAISAYTTSVGITGNLTKYAAAFNVFQPPGSAVAQMSNSLFVENFNGAATSVRIAATATGALLNAATAGALNVWVLKSALP